MPNKTKPFLDKSNPLGAAPSISLVWVLGAVLCTHLKSQASPSPPNDCPASFVTQPPQAAEDQLAALQWAQRHGAACEQRADYHAHMGSLLLALRQTQQAANALEKSLLLNPEQPGTKLDYAHALALLGERASAQEIVNQVTARPDIHPGLRQWLLGTPTERTEIRPSWSWAQLLQTTAGHETNLSSASSANAVTLHLSNGPVLVPLDDGAKPQSGAGLKNLLAIQGQSPVGGPDIRLSMALQTRNAPGLADNHLAAMSATFVKPLEAGQMHLRWEGHYFHRNNSFTYQDQGLSLQYHFTPSTMPCRWRASFGSTAQHFAGNTELNGRYNQMRLEASCKHRDQSETHWGVGSGLDRAQTSQRPGGDKTRLDWTVRHERPIGTATIQTWIRQTRMNDSERFSPILGDLVSRSTRVDLGAGAWWPLSAQWSGGLDVESTSQKSSNPLLNINNLSIYAGLRWTSR